MQPNVVGRPHSEGKDVSTLVVFLAGGDNRPGASRAADRGSQWSARWNPRADHTGSIATATARRRSSRHALDVSGPMLTPGFNGLDDRSAEPVEVERLLEVLERAGCDDPPSHVFCGVSAQHDDRE